jgi:hypothetical protein
MRPCDVFLHRVYRVSSGDMRKAAPSSVSGQQQQALPPLSIEQMAHGLEACATKSVSVSALLKLAESHGFSPERPAADLMDGLRSDVTGFFNADLMPASWGQVRSWRTGAMSMAVAIDVWHGRGLWDALSREELAPTKVQLQEMIKRITSACNGKLTAAQFAVQERTRLACNADPSLKQAASWPVPVQEEDDAVVATCAGGADEDPDGAEDWGRADSDVADQAESSSAATTRRQTDRGPGAVVVAAADEDAHSDASVAATIEPGDRPFVELVDAFVRYGGAPREAICDALMMVLRSPGEGAAADVVRFLIPKTSKSNFAVNDMLMYLAQKAAPCLSWKETNR